MNNFTPRAQQVLALARKEADRFHHNYVGTEHILLGLIKLGQGVAVSVLQKMGLDLETVRAAVEKQVGRFLPYTMSHGRQPPTWMLRLYLTMPVVWRLFGKQFLVIGRKPALRSDGANIVGCSCDR